MFRFLVTIMVAIIALQARPGAAFTAMPTRIASGAQRSPFCSQRSFAAPRGVEMNLAGRFLRVARANLNSILTRWEDPEKVLDQTVEEMNRDLVKVRQSYAEVTATQKRMEKQREQAAALAQEWYGRAQLALEKGDEELAREALTRRQQQTETAESLEQQLRSQEDAVQQLYDAMGQLEARITEAKSTKEQLVARARTAKTTTKVNDMLSNVGDGKSSMAAFDRMAEKVDALEAEAEVTGQLAGTAETSVEQKFKALEGAGKVDDELAKLKGAIGGAETKALPSAIDDELEKLKKQQE